MTPRGSTRLRLFLTSWILFGAMFATNFVREHYPALNLVETGSYALDRYYLMHSDIFWHEKHAYINNNVGASVIAAAVLLPFKPVLKALEKHSLAEIARNGGVVDTSFDTQHPNRASFYRLARENGWELKFGAVAAITAVLLMAPLSALCVLLVFDFLRGRGMASSRSVVLAMLFGFGTPVLFRTAHLNHNMMVMYGAFGAFLALVPSDPAASMRARPGRGRAFGAGLLAGAGVMSDYSGVVPLLWLGGWSLASGVRGRRPDPIFFAIGAVLPICVQLQSQWISFGSWFTPPQVWMAEANFTDRGYRGLDWPALDLFLDNLIEPRWGLFAYGPLLALGLLPPRRNDPGAPLPFPAWAWTMAACLAFMLFAAANQYGRMQWNTGVRYLMPVVPFFFLAAANHLARMKGAWLALLGGAAALHSWVVSMRRESVLGVGGDWSRFLHEGPRLPWLDVLARTATGHGKVPEGSAIHVAVIVGVVLIVVLIWWVGRRPVPST